MLANCRDEISIRPKLPAPELFLDLRTVSKDLSGRNALNPLDYLLWTHHRYRLHEEMYMIAIRSNLQKCDLIAFANLQANFLELLVNRRCKDRSSVLRWTDDVIQQNRDVVTLMDEAAHPHSLTQQAARNSPCRD